MKKIAKICFAILFIVSTFLPFNVVKADDGYYYKDVNIKVNVNEAREYEITEVLTVHFSEESHGIIRTIPLYSNVESYSITDISVEGAKYVLDQGSSEMRIKIGDADVWVKGDMTYTIKYKLVHFKDYDDEADYIYLNLVGQSFDTSIENLTAKITYPANAKWEKTTVTSGTSYSTENPLTDFKQDRNVITVQSIKTIPAYNSVTLQVQFAQDSFPKAPVYVYPYVITNMTTEIEITTQKEFLVKRHYEIRNDSLSAQTHFVPTDIGSYSYGEYAKVDDFVSSSEDYCHLASDSVYISLPANGEYSCDFSYTLDPYAIKSRSYVDWNFFETYADTKIENYKITIKTPFTFPSYELFFGRYSDDRSMDTFADVSFENNTLIITGKKVLQNGERINATLYLDNSVFSRPLPASYPFAIIACVIIAAIFIAINQIVFGKKRSIVQTVEFYPPYGMNSIEAGYLIDNEIQDTDISSIIFYWASMGYIRILNTSKNNYTFYRLLEPNNKASDYEVNLFNSMFVLGDGEVVTTKELKGKFFAFTNIAKKRIIEIYKKEPNNIWDKSTQRIKALGMVLACIPTIISLLVISQMLRNSAEMFFLLSIVLSPVTAITLIIVSILRLMAKVTPKAVILTLVITIVAPVLLSVLVVAIPYFSIEHFIIFGIGLLATIVCLVSANGFKKYSSFGNDILGKLYGFKDFIVTAEKDRLEMLLEEDPEYYYHILPYAQVLKVTKIWQKKFKDITMEAPTWYESSLSYSHTTFMSDFINATNTVARATLPPASSGGGGSGGSSSSGGYSGGGGGFSSGGSSGGGSGGGGSSRW